MLVEFDPLIFQTDESRQKFSFLLYLFYLHRRYDFFIDLAQVSDSALYSSLAKDDQAVIEEYFNRSVNDSKSIDMLIVNDTNDDYFDLDEAIYYFQQPLELVLENSLNDKYFLETIVNKFSNRGKKIRRHLDNNWITIANAGGRDNILNLLTEKINAIKKQPKPPEKYFRCVVIVDSDSTYPGEVKPTQQQLQSFLIQMNIPFHILTKREMENYLPDLIFGDIPNNPEYLSAYMRLTPLQKDYFDIQNGFDRNLNSYSQQVQDLYADVSKADFGEFRKGGINFANFKSEFPKLFLSEKVTQENLKKRVEHQMDDPNELETILNLVNSLL